MPHSKVVISTEYNNHHQDFQAYELEELFEYLDTFDYYESNTLQGAVEQAIDNEADYIVEPVNGDQDLTVNFKYI